MKSLLSVGLVGCGNISPAYFNGCAPYPWIQITACADLDLERAKARAAEFKIPKACSPADLLADPGIDIVLNLTVPAAHATINLAALKAGKHVYAEKPFAIEESTGRKVMEIAKRKKLRVGCAPDTFFGGGAQTARKLIDDGVIGAPVAATAFLAGHGMEMWHPNPEFFYQRGGGPMLDMGPYYITALVNCLGPVKRLTGSTRITFKERTITAPARTGVKFKVSTPTHVTGTLEFSSGPIATIITSFDVWGHHLPRIEIHGSAASLSIPDPNGFGGPVLLLKSGAKEWEEIPLTHRTDAARGIGLADMARGILARRSHRASGELANHVLEVMLGFEKSSTAGKHVTLKSTCKRPAALPTGLALGELD